MRRALAVATGGLLGLVLLVTGTACLTSGCSTIGYYGQSVAGHLSLLKAARPVPALLADPATPEPLRERLALSQRIRDFAVRDLALPDNASYRRYAELGRPAAVWNVVAAPELGLTLKTWCFPVVGCVGYRGYYAREDAEAYASTLREQGLDVAVYGVPAYSTLGRLPRWDAFADPLLSTFIRWPEGELARLLIHELSHQVAYANDDTQFNESYATAVERLGGKRWLERHADAAAREAYAQLDARREDFRALTFAWRMKFEALYAGAGSEADKRAGKAALLAGLRAEYETLKREKWGGFAGYDGWFERANNASLGVLAAYNALVPDFERLFERQGRDFARFHAEVRRIAALPDRAQRRAALSSSSGE